MAFIPHTKHDVRTMLETIGVSSIQDLFCEIPECLKDFAFSKIPEGISEMEMLALMQARAEQDPRVLNFIGAGAYEHHIPAAVWDLVGRGEFYSAYTPYQAEASQGTLQLLYQYQTMMASLTGMDASNASMYDGASATSEAILMALRLQKKGDRKTVLIAGTLHPAYRETAQCLVSAQGISLVEVPLDAKTGCLDLQAFHALLRHDVQQEIAALVIAQPNFLGQLESVDLLTDQAHQQGLIVIGVVNPISLAVFKAPGQWGERGADIACGEGQPLGVPLSAGGPYVGFLTCKQDHIRQMPGRIIGRTMDADGRTGFVLTLQAREQHIRRAKATSNICTNQSLLVTANTIYLSLMGHEGLTRVAHQSAAGLRALAQHLAGIAGVCVKFDIHNSFCEAVLALPIPAKTVIEKMLKEGILAGFDLGLLDPLMNNNLLICVTETKTPEMLVQYAECLARVLK